jgi:hypothetical protein
MAAFAVVERAEGSMAAIVDRVRTVPLFYAQHDGRRYLSGDAYQIADPLPPEPFDDVLAVEIWSSATSRAPTLVVATSGSLGQASFGSPMRDQTAVSTQRYHAYNQRDYHGRAPVGRLANARGGATQGSVLICGSMRPPTQDDGRGAAPLEPATRHREGPKGGPSLTSPSA